MQCAWRQILNPGTNGPARIARDGRAMRSKAALSDIVLLGTEEQVQLAASAAAELAAGRQAHMHEGLSFRCATSSARWSISKRCPPIFQFRSRVRRDRPAVVRAARAKAARRTMRKAAAARAWAEWVAWAVARWAAAQASTSMTSRIITTESFADRSTADQRIARLRLYGDEPQNQLMRCSDFASKKCSAVGV